MAYNRLQRAEAQPESPPKMTAAALGDQLKGYFDAMTLGPIPDRLLRLTDALEQAFERGELRCCESRTRTITR